MATVSGVALPFTMVTGGGEEISPFRREANLTDLRQNFYTKQVRFVPSDGAGGGPEVPFDFHAPPALAANYDACFQTRPVLWRMYQWTQHQGNTTRTYAASILVTVTGGEPTPARHASTTARHSAVEGDRRLPGATYIGVNRGVRRSSRATQVGRT